MGTYTLPFFSAGEPISILAATRLCPMGLYHVTGHLQFVATFPHMPAIVIVVKPRNTPSISERMLGLSDHLWLTTRALFVDKAHFYKIFVSLHDKNH